jgi:hypothetical protein
MGSLYACLLIFVSVSVCVFPSRSLRSLRSDGDMRGQRCRELRQMRRGNFVRQVQYRLPTLVHRRRRVHVRYATRAWTRNATNSVLRIYNFVFVCLLNWLVFTKNVSACDCTNY